MNSLQFAINMELEGEKYYRNQAKIHETDSLKIIFSNLAKDEANHAKKLQDRLKNLPKECVYNESYMQEERIFQQMHDFKVDTKQTPAQLDVYRFALEREEESVALYKKMLSENQDEKELFEFLIRQEELHCLLLNHIIQHVSRPDGWPESAEFGIREEY